MKIAVRRDHNLPLILENKPDVHALPAQSGQLVPRAGNTHGSTEVRKAELTCTHRFFRLCQPSHMKRQNKAHNGSAVEGLQTFKLIAHDGGFVDLKESEDGTVLWLRRQSPDAATNIHQRICMDSVTNSVTVYWMTSLGKAESETFRTAAGLREWLGTEAAG